ncbi:MAG TPA: polysaccharide deacetylase family protein [Solirubrobacter sp.]|nr:polysaccharide deacetylase family protein [Solirubrobacter sp.]
MIGVRWGAVGAAAWLAPAPAAHVPLLARACGLRRHTDQPGVLLTFDDGPHPQGTPRVLAELDRVGARAVFFVVGEQVAAHPGLLEEIAAAGHELALHGERHRCLARLTPAALRADLDRAAARLGRPARLHRAPLGIYTPYALAHVRRRGLTPLLWSAWGRDWRRRATPASVAHDVLRAAAPGGVILLHDADDYSAPGSWRATTGALPRILDGLAARGLALADPALSRPAP